MPYFKNEKGAKGYVNDEEMMARLEEAGYIRLEGTELFLRIIVEALKKWGVPALVAWIIFYLTDDFASSIILMLVTQNLLA